MENGLDLDRRDIIIDYLHRMDNTVRHSKGISVFRRIKGIPATCGKKTLDDYVESARERRERMLDFINRSEHKVVADGLTMRAETAKQYADEKNYEALKTQSSARLRVELADEEYIVHKKNWEKAEEEAQRLDGEAHIAWLISQGIDPWKVSTPPILEEPEPTPPPTPGQFIEIDESSISNFQDQVIENSSKLSIEDWSKEMLATYLKAVDMEPVANKFLENFIDGQALKVMMDDILEQLIVDIPLGMQLKMRKLVDTARQGLTPKFPENVNLNEIPLTAETKASQLFSKEFANQNKALEGQKKTAEAKVIEVGERLKNTGKKEADDKTKKISEEKKLENIESKKVKAGERLAEEKARKIEIVAKERERLLKEQKKQTEQISVEKERAEELEKSAEDELNAQEAKIKRNEEKLEIKDVILKKMENEKRLFQEPKRAAEQLAKEKEEERMTVIEEKQKVVEAKEEMIREADDKSKALAIIADEMKKKNEELQSAGEKDESMVLTIKQLLMKIAELEAIVEELHKEIQALKDVAAKPAAPYLPVLVIETAP